MPFLRHAPGPAWPRILHYDILGDCRQLQRTGQRRQQRIGEMPADVNHKNVPETSQEEGEIWCSKNQIIRNFLVYEWKRCRTELTFDFLHDLGLVRVEARLWVVGGREGRRGHDDGRSVPAPVRPDLHHELVGGPQFLVGPRSLWNGDVCQLLVLRHSM